MTIFSAVGVVFLCALQLPVWALEIDQLRCEDLRGPEGIDVPRPRLSWILRSAERGKRQSAYQILVASSSEKLAANRGNLWDSGRVDSEQSTYVRYGGAALVSGEECFWKVRVWDAEGKPGPWSPAARWSMGLLVAGDWRAQWIGRDEPGLEPGLLKDRRLPARWLRKEFAVGKNLRRATVYYSGLGISELYLNGHKVGNEVLSPGLTEYTKRVFYVTHEVKSLLHPGANALGAVLGNGWYFGPRAKAFCGTRSFGYPKLLLQMRIEYQDGSTATVVSDETWKLTTEGPIRDNNEYDGEDYDARMELGAWSEPGYNDSKWRTAQLVSSAGGAAHSKGVLDYSNLCAQRMEPIRVTQTLKPLSVTEPTPGTYIFDLGQNMVGWCRLSVSGPRGTTVVLRHGETLGTNGALYVENLRSAKATDLYTLKGQGKEVYTPRFTYHGFRYVEVTGYPGKPPLSAIEGEVIHDDLDNAGQFACSEPVLNRICENIRWGVRGNYRSLSTDCPQRDERLGWLGDRSTGAKGETYLFNNVALYRKWLRDMADAQKDNGSVPDICPPYRLVYSDNVTWPSTSVIVPGEMYEQYGDIAFVEEHYDCMKGWMNYMSRFISTNGIISRDAYGDWCVPPEDSRLIHSKDPARKTDGAFLATAYFYNDARLLAEYAKLLGRTEDAARFDKLAESLKSSFNAKFFRNGQYDNGSQTSCVLPLSFGLVPDDLRPGVFAHLLRKIQDESQGHVGTGLIGGQWLMRVLSDNGRPEVAYQLATQRTYPGWGYMVEKGATTIWELWNGDTADPSMNSGNHCMLVGDLGIWLFEYLAGIKPDPALPGFKHILMRPQPLGNLTFVRATHRSPYGLIRSDWWKDAIGFHWKVTVPVNATATLYVPAQSADGVRESGRAISRAAGVKFARMEGGRAVFEVGSGQYNFGSRP
jgi:alpha-L-rhamnosidase